MEQTSRGLLLRAHSRLPYWVPWVVMPAFPLLLLILGANPAECLFWFSMIFATTGPVLAALWADRSSTDVITLVQRTVLVGKRSIPGGTEPILEVDGRPILSGDVRSVVIRFYGQHTIESSPVGQIYIVTRRRAFLVETDTDRADAVAAAHLLRGSLGLPYQAISVKRMQVAAMGMVVFILLLMVSNAGAVYLGPQLLSRSHELASAWGTSLPVIAGQALCAWACSLVIRRLAGEPALRLARDLGVDV